MQATTGNTGSSSAYVPVNCQLSVSRSRSISRQARELAFFYLVLAVWLLIDLQAAPAQANAPRLIRDAGTAHNRGDYDRALHLYKNALELEPGNAFAHHMYGRTLSVKGLIDEAIIHYQEALRLGRNKAELLNDLGVVLAGTGELDEAARCLSKATEIDPRFVAAYNNLGTLLFQQGKYIAASQAFTKALRIQPENTYIRNKLAQIKNLSRVIEKAPAPKKSTEGAATEQGSSSSVTMDSGSTLPQEKRPAMDRNRN